LCASALTHSTAVFHFATVYAVSNWRVKDTLAHDWWLFGYISSFFQSDVDSHSYVAVPLVNCMLPSVSWQVSARSITT